jgi:hypothetical protein
MAHAELGNFDDAWHCVARRTLGRKNGEPQGVIALGSLSGSLRLGKPNRTAGHRGMGDHAYQLNTERQGCRGMGCRTASLTSQR